MGKQFYRQKVGIPQGSVLSSILCNIFYADLEKEKLPFLADSEGLLLRLIDDFLFISMNKDHANEFLQVMNDGKPYSMDLTPGHPQYGCSINMEKSLVNFNITINSRKAPRLHSTKYFPFCGTSIHTETLDITKDLTRLRGTSITPYSKE
jgi:telomerase reverse transcriptase